MTQREREEAAERYRIKRENRRENRLRTPDHKLARELRRSCRGAFGKWPIPLWNIAVLGTTGIRRSSKETD